LYEVIKINISILLLRYIQSDEVSVSQITILHVLQTHPPSFAFLITLLVYIKPNAEERRRPIYPLGGIYLRETVCACWSHVKNSRIFKKRSK
jgi:hypothetical protein